MVIVVPCQIAIAAVPEAVVGAAVFGVDIAETALGRCEGDLVGKSEGGEVKEGGGRRAHGGCGMPREAVDFYTFAVEDILCDSLSMVLVMTQAESVQDDNLVISERLVQ